MINPYVESTEIEVSIKAPDGSSVPFRVPVSWTTGAPEEFCEQAVYVGEGDHDIGELLSPDAHEALMREVGRQLIDQCRERRAG